MQGLHAGDQKVILRLRFDAEQCWRSAGFVWRPQFLNGLTYIYEHARSSNDDQGMDGADQQS